MSESVIQIRNGSTFDWELFNPVLAKGELGVDNEELTIKVGDGYKPWSKLNVFPPTPDFHPFIAL